MNAQRRFGILVFIGTTVFAILACTCSTLGIGEEPTPTPLPPTPTQPPTQPPAATELPPTPEPPPTKPAGDAQLEILDVNGYQDQFDSVFISGLIQNNSGIPVRDISVEIEVFDSADISIYKDTTFTHLFTVLPGAQTPFSYSVFDELVDPARFEATVLDATVLDSSPDSVTVEDQNVRLIFDDDGDVHLAGELVAADGGPVEIVSLAAGTSFGNINYIVPENPGPFSIHFTSPATGFPDEGNWKLYIEAVRPTETPTLSFTLSEVYDYRDGFNNLHIVGDVTNDNAEAVTVRLIAAIYDEDGNVIDVSTTDTPFFTISPSETIPYDLSGWSVLDYTDELEI